MAKRMCVENEAFEEVKVLEHTLADVFGRRELEDVASEGAGTVVGRIQLQQREGGEDEGGEKGEERRGRRGKQGQRDAELMWS